MSKTYLNKNWLGPFLCKPSTSSMGFWISQGRDKSDSIIEVQLWRAEDPANLSRETFFPTGNVYGVSIAEVDDLVPNTKYYYRILVDDAPHLADGLSGEDLFFYTLPNAEDEIEILMMSCHGVEAYQQDPVMDASKAWDMWKRLEGVLDDGGTCRLGVLGGDQVYMDYTFGEDLQRFDPLQTDKTQLSIYMTYHYYWNHISYRRILARLPCLLMWDDHDIIDGWGSREEANYSRTKKKWDLYGKHLFTAFDEMQSVRNSGVKISNECRSFYFEWGTLGIFALDLRSNRMTLADGSRQMLSRLQRENIDRKIGNLSDHIKTVLIVSPVTLTRMGGRIETFLGGISSFLWQLSERISYGKSVKRAILWATLFSVCYIGLYIDTKVFVGAVQSFFALIATMSLTLFNYSAIKKYFPKRSQTVLIGLAIVIAYALCFAFAHISVITHSNDGYSAFLSDLAEALELGKVKTLWGLGLSILAIAAIGVGSSKTLRNKISNRINGDFIQSSATSLSFIAIASVSIFNWSRGLPNSGSILFGIGFTILLVIFSLITFFAFIMSIIEVTGIVDKVASLNDDIEDSWSAQSHSGEMEWLTSAIGNIWSEGKRKVLVLSGDIHTAGLTTLNLRSGDKFFKVPQVTSSPMSYVTMPPLVEKLTSGISEMPILGSNRNLGSAKNIFYRSERNFVILKYAQGTVESVSFHFEDLEEPVEIKM